MVSLGEISGEQFWGGALQTVEGTTMKLVIPSALAVSVMVTSVFGKSESAHVVCERGDLTFRREKESANCFSVSKIGPESFMTPCGQPVSGQNALNPEVYDEVSALPM
jgi:hypothetical protein